MDNKRCEGRLVRWNDDRGFGFITSDDHDRDVFLHISALKKMRRHPIVGDTINYILQAGKDGKYKARDARIKGVAIVQSAKKSTRKQRKSRSIFPILIFFLIFVFAAYKMFVGQGNLLDKTGMSDSIESISSSLSHSPAEQKKLTRKYSCQGKVYCSEMTSCEEAKFYQRNCPGTKMDGDGDGVPCEKQWCSH